MFYTSWKDPSYWTFCKLVIGQKVWSWSFIMFWVRHGNLIWMLWMPIEACLLVQTCKLTSFSTFLCLTTNKIWLWHKMHLFKGEKRLAMIFYIRRLPSILFPCQIQTFIMVIIWSVFPFTHLDYFIIYLQEFLLRAD